MMPRMTTPMPPTPPVPPLPLLTVLPPSPMTVGQALSSTVAILKRRIGFFLALAFVPGLLIGVVMTVAILLGGGILVSSLVGLGYGSYPSGGQVAGAVVLGGLIMLVATLGAVAIQIKANGMITLLAHETALGRTPDYAALNSGTRGIVGRSVVLIIAAVLAGGLVAVLLYAPMIAAITGSSRTAAERLAGAAVLTMLLSLVVSLGSVYLSTRWLYLNQGLAIEGRDGFAALGSSWRLTRNDFWRTLGWYLLAGLLLSVVAWVVVGIFGALTEGLTSSRSSVASGAGAALTVVYLIMVVLLEALIAPATMSYTTVMYIDQQRRLQLAGTAPRWTPPQQPTAPAWPAQPAQPAQPGGPSGSTWTPHVPGTSQPPGTPGIRYGYGPDTGDQQQPRP